MISEITQKLKKKEISCVEITSQYLEKVEKNNPEINAFITVTKKEAMQTAKNVDAEIANSNDLEGLFIKKPLLGIPIAHKDIFTTKGIETTAGSSILKGYIPPFNATVVDKLNNSGVVTLGK
ncbi:Asp-tRNA(Asn)/Glu-tRNA(Gln) amidotransferase GatCAB subunit A, partial [candidate division WWE3 bacterium CG_4_9_14_3_um_filter_34_6]